MKKSLVISNQDFSQSTGPKAKNASGIMRKSLSADTFDFHRDYASQVLFADDDPLIRRSMERYLKYLLPERCELIISATAEDAKSIINDQALLPDYSVVISDFDFQGHSYNRDPKMLNGRDLAIATINERLQRSIGFILYTADLYAPTDPETEKVIKNGTLDACLTKPMDPKNIIEALERVIISKIKKNHSIKAPRE